MKKAKGTDDDGGSGLLEDSSQKLVAAKRDEGQASRESAETSR
jgi:hypothetical protein